MSFFIVIRKQIKEGMLIPTNTKNPSKEELLNNLQSYPKIYLLSSLGAAKNVAELFFNAPMLPKTGGSYGLIAQVEATFTNESEMTNASEIYNNWVATQTLGYIKKEESDASYPCYVVSPKQVESILNSYIPENAKAFNSNLQDTEFMVSEQVSKAMCSIL